MGERLPCSLRTFPMVLSSWLPASYAFYLHWLRHLLERIGLVRTLALFQLVCQDYDDGLVLQILPSLHVRECEWARYFRECHPQVGY